MTAVSYEAVADGFEYHGTDRDEVIGMAGDHWSVQATDRPVKVYRVQGSIRALIWQDGQPWPIEKGPAGRPPRKR